jgi:hypothetical protein
MRSLRKIIRGLPETNATLRERYGLGQIRMTANVPSVLADMRRNANSGTSLTSPAYCSRISSHGHRR